MRPVLVGTACALALVTAPAFAFDCAKARAKVERAICADPTSKAADDAMIEAFTSLRKRLDADASKALLTNQRQWLKERDGGCADAASLPACLRDANHARVRALSGTPEAGPGLPRAPVPVFVERPGSRKAYATSLMLYRFDRPATEAERRLDAFTRKTIDEAPVTAEDASDGAPWSHSRPRSSPTGPSGCSRCW